MKNKTLVLGASENPERYSNKAIRKLRSTGHDVLAIGNKTGMVDGVAIAKDLIESTDVDTVTMYLSAPNQRSYYNYVISLKPRRVIFNPGAENEELETLLESNGIEPVEACTLVMLSTHQF